MLWGIALTWTPPQRQEFGIHNEAVWENRTITDVFKIKYLKLKNIGDIVILSNAWKKRKNGKKKQVLRKLFLSFYLRTKDTGKTN